MFTPDELEALPISLVKLFNILELDVMTDIVRKLANLKDISASADYQMSRLYELGVSKIVIHELVQDTLQKSDNELDNIFDYMIDSGYAHNEEIYQLTGKKFIPYKENESLQQFVKAVKAQTKNDYKNITQSLGFAVKGNDGKLGFKPVAKFYQQTLDKATAGIISGTFDYNAIIKQAVNDMTNSGLRTVDYKNGRSNRIEVAVRRAILTGVNQITAQINNEVAEQLGTEYFEVSYHRGARPTHQVWQGRVYSKQDLEIVCGLGTVTGLCGANCRHSYAPFVIGVSQRTYTDDELERMNDEENTPKEYNGKQYTLYEATQRQRKLETLMRKQREDIKLLEAGKAGDNEINAAKARYFSTSDDYVKFSKAMNLSQQRERITVDGKNALGSKLPKKAESVNKISGEAVHRISDSSTLKNNAEIIRKDVAKSQKTVIIKSEGVLDLEQAKKRDHKIYITDVALSKISKSAVPKYSKNQNLLIDEIHKELLTRSKNTNNSNEVAYLFNLNSGERAYRNGSEHEVNIFKDPIAYAMSNSSEDKSLFLAHNHPSTQTFSYSDLGVFLCNDSIGAMSVVSNTGDVHILFKSDKYSYTKAIEKLMDIKDEFGGYSPDADLLIVKLFLKNSEKIGINKY